MPQPWTRVRLWMWYPALLLILSAASASPSLASQSIGAAPVRQGTAPFDGADVVFLIDQSGSMGGSTVHPTANDPDKRRFEVARFAIDFLAQMRYTYVKQSNSTWDARVSVIYFGSLADRVQSIRRPIENLVIAPDSPDQWTSPWAQVEPRLAPSEINLGDTDFRLAFDQARLQFERMQQERPNQRRVRSIILVTDGAPAPTCTETEAGRQCENPIQHMNELEEDLANFYTGQDNRLYVVALNDVDPYWTGGPNQRAYGPIWQRIVDNRGFAKLVGSNTDITAEVQKAINETLDPFVCRQASDVGCPKLVTDTVNVLPYINQITFIVHKIKTDDKVDFLNGGMPVDLSQAVRENTDKLVETIRIPSPAPGKWAVVRPEGRNVTIYKTELIDARYRLELPADTSAIGCGRPATLALHLQKPNGDPIAELPGYEIRHQLQFAWENGPQAVDLGRPIQPGLYQERLVFLNQGRDVPVWLRATTKDPDGAEVVLFDNEISRMATPDCRYDWFQQLPQRMDQYSVITPTLVLMDGTTPLPLTVANEYEIQATIKASGGGITQDLQSTWSADNKSALVELQPTQCSDIKLQAIVNVRDLQDPSKPAQTVFTSAEHTIAVDCKTLVRMMVVSNTPSNLAACTISGQRPTITWQAHFEDEQGSKLMPQTVLNQPGSSPITASLIDTKARAVVANQQLVSTTGEYTWQVKDLPPGAYQAQMDFTGNLKSSYIKDASSIRYETPLALTSPQNISAVRTQLGIGTGVGIMLLLLLIFLVGLRPRRGPVPQEKLLLTPAGMEAFGELAKVSLPLRGQKKQKISADDEPRLRDYADELLIRQHPDAWDQIEVTQIVDGQVRATTRLDMFGAIMLENRQPMQKGATLEYWIPDYEKAQTVAREKVSRDRRIRNLFFVLGTIVALLLATSVGYAVPLGC